MTDHQFLPNCRKSGGSIGEEALGFIRFVFQDRSFDGMVFLAAKDAHGRFKTIGPVPCGQIVPFVQQTTIFSDHDYYISSNLFFDKTRSKDTLLAINAIVIDIDCHSENYSSCESAQRIEVLVRRLQNDCFDCGDLPQPNYIILTGRGVQLWWCVVPAYAKSFRANFSDVEGYFASKIDDLISDFPSELLDFSVDLGASSNAAGLFRLPGTVNTHCQKKVETIYFHDQRINLKDFRDQFLPVTSRSARRETVNIRFRPYTQNTLEDVLLKRLDAIEKLRSIRNAPLGEERRNDFCFVYYVTANGIYDDAEAYRHTQDFNAGFKNPLSDKELKSSLCSARRKDYKYSVKGIMEKLDITPEEASEIGLHAPKPRLSASNKVDKGPLSTQTTAKTNEIFSEIDLYEPFLCGDLSFSQNDALSSVDDTNQARIEAAVMGTLLAAETQDCNLFISSIAMKSQVNGFLQYHADPKRSWIPLTLRQVSDACNNLCQKGLVIADYSATKGDCYFLKHNYSYEKEKAELLTALIKSQPKCSLPPTVIFQAIRQYEVVAGFTLSQEQRDAIFLALKKTVAIVTGGPGTGKTAIMAALCHVLKSAAPKARVKLCAPTGKAAVHLSKVTGVTAATMHSLKSKRINCDFLIIDEASMVDIALLHDTLQMVSKGAHILFLGDTDQLPCIGGGNVLRDMISCKKIPIANLSQVYRQNEETGLGAYVNTIRTALEDPSLPESCSIDDSICFISLREKSEIEQKVVEIAESMKSRGHEMGDVQILAPTREWSDNLNLHLKAAFNPVPDGQDLKAFTIGDYVIYTKNDYVNKLHNGQVGIISSTTEKTITVNYNGQAICHSKTDWEHLSLAYSLTIHKAQGSEYPIVIIPIHESMGRALSRNLIYTAVTRSKEKCIIVGSEQALLDALGRTLLHTHKSMLAERLRDMIK